ncbi:hypothetical protein ACLOJK_004076 [Asimina triloba]
MEIDDGGTGSVGVWACNCWVCRIVMGGDGVMEDMLLESVIDGLLQMGLWGGAVDRA